MSTQKSYNMSVKVWEETVIIPTYEVGEPDKNPMFLEKRVYQGSTGKVYPYPTTEKIAREKKDKEYQALYLENDYLKVMILPELGGRIQRAYDKTNDYDFVYYNKVIKPALVGLIGPWISGGIEFNWPQHHRPTTFMPLDYQIKENKDGSKSVLVHDVDQMYGTKGITKFTLYPDKAYIEIQGQLYNPTPFPQTFLWWANPAVAANDHTQSIFPPDVHSVYDHGKRDVSRFPIATGTYYKYDYSEGVDISRYKNIPVPTSFMAEKSEYDFVGGYDYQKEAGILHVADHHISPGKKQWTWGCGEFGQAWDRNLTDEDGPYIELMTGVYTDNQPDFTWLKPYEEKKFKQYFMPYKEVGAVKNATIDCILNLDLKKENKIDICVYATSVYENVEIIILDQDKEIFKENTLISPNRIFKKSIDYPVNHTKSIKAKVVSEGKQLVEYEPKEAELEELAVPAQAAKDPKEIMTTEELFLTGQHIEQYRHATYLPDTYYLEGLKRDDGDIRINNAYGLLLMRRGLWKEGECYFRKALKRLLKMNPNPYDSEVYYNLGMTLFYQNNKKEAFEAFYKATWSSEQQEKCFYYLAAIKAQDGEYEPAYEFIEKALVKNIHNVKARGLKAYILRKLKQKEAAEQMLQENMEIDEFDYLSLYEKKFLDEEKIEEGEWKLTCETALRIARDYGEMGAFEEAVLVLESCKQESPLVYFYKGYYYYKLGQVEDGFKEYSKGEACDPTRCFPNKMEDIQVLKHAIQMNKTGAKAYYYLGNLFYDKLQFETAITYWEESEKLDSNYPTLLRNLALGYYNKRKQPKLAREKLEQAFKLDQSDARVFLELDQLYKKQNVLPEKRLHNYQEHFEIIRERDDLYTEYVVLLNTLGRHKEAYNAIMDFTFRPWEGAEGKISTQYKVALLESAKQEMKKENYQEAKLLIEKALIYPDNLGEGRLEGTKENALYFYLGCIYEKLQQPAEAKKCFQLATLGASEPAGMMYYNDQPADVILYQGKAFEKLGSQNNANSRYYSLIDYGEIHFRDEMTIDYFAVSLPDFLIFEENLDIRNRAHCYYLMGLGQLGLKKEAEAKRYFEQVLKIDLNHQNANIFIKEL